MDNGGRSVDYGRNYAIRIHRVDPWLLRLRRRSDALRGITLASVGRIQAPWIGRQGVVEGAGLMGIRRQFRVRNLSSCGTWREFWRICFSFVFDEGGCKIGWVAKWILIVTGEWVALPNRNNCPSFRSRTKILGTAKFRINSGSTEKQMLSIRRDKILWFVHWFVSVQGIVLDFSSIFFQHFDTVFFNNFNLELRFRTIIQFYLPKITRNIEKFR